MTKIERAALPGGPKTKTQRDRYIKASPEIQEKSRELAGRRSVQWAQRRALIAIRVESAAVTVGGPI
jgi:hypothetical protein